MDTFEKTVMGVALVVLLLALTFFGIQMGKRELPKVEPAACPNFWQSSYFKPCDLTEFKCCADGVTPANADKSNCSLTPCSVTGDCCPDGITKKVGDGSACPAAVAKCYNRKLDSACGQEVDFNESKYTGTNGLCEKQNWAKQCNMNWDGVTNVPNAC